MCVCVVCVYVCAYMLACMHVCVCVCVCLCVKVANRVLLDIFNQSQQYEHHFSKSMYLTCAFRKDLWHIPVASWQLAWGREGFLGFLVILK